MKNNLSQKQRIIVAGIYLVALALIFNFIGGNFKNLAWDSNIDSSIWFYAGAFMIILGTYIVEPFFTKPSDVIANSVAVLIALFGLSDKHGLIGYSFILYYATTLLLLSVFTIFLKDVQSYFFKKISKIIYWIVECLGSSKVIFSIVYLSASYSYFADEGKIISFISIISFWVIITFFDAIGYIVSKVSKLFNYFLNKVGDELGLAIGCENPFLFRVEIDYSKHKPKKVPKYGDIIAIETSANSGSLGMIISVKHLLGKRWLSVYLFKDKSGEIIKIDLKERKLISDSKTIFTKDNLAYQVELDNLLEDVQKKIKDNYLYSNKSKFIGYVTAGSNINKINFTILRDFSKKYHRISEGVILKTNIYDTETLYQVIDGATREEHLENFDSHGYTIGIARKLGEYNSDEGKKELETVKWMPKIYSPLFFTFDKEVEEEKLKEIAQSAVGRLPETDFEIPIKDVNSFVTHNTAILGILGIGKSCLSYEIIKKISESDIKIICIDITNEYKRELINYTSDDVKIIPDEIDAFNSINEKYEYIHDESGTKNYEKSGNVVEYKNALAQDLLNFLFDKDSIPDDKQLSANKKIRIYNPDYHKVSKGEKIGFNVITTDLTQAEKTRIISEEIFRILMQLPLPEKKEAKILLVFEEAHSLVPEWNSVANEGDKNATNGTAKVILQGRKYGLGSLVVTQRTANVSKSILNQCNTIFALRVFDDTGKGFLKNYIGEDYANTLPTLEERHAIAIGKGLMLKQPVIIQLNDRKFFIKKK